MAQAAIRFRSMSCGGAAAANGATAAGASTAMRTRLNLPVSPRTTATGASWAGGRRSSASAAEMQAKQMAPPSNFAQMGIERVMSGTPQARKKEPAGASR